MKIRLYLLLLVVLILALGCQNKPANSTPNTDSTAVAAVDSVQPKPTATPPVADSAAIRQLAADLLKFAADKNYAAIADFIHPKLGLRFSPYAYVDTAEHKRFMADEFRAQVKDNAKKKVLWGTSDPLGEPIKLSVEGYFKEFGYDKDYLGKGKAAYNEAIGSSTTIDNCAEVFPKANFVEYYYGGGDPEQEPFNWGSVRLVFEVLDGKPYVVAWIHNAWST